MVFQRKKISFLIKCLALFLVFLFSISWFTYRVDPGRITGYLGVRLLSSAVGVSIGVPENPFNSAAEQLKEKEMRLNEREAVLNQLEKQLLEEGFLKDGKLILILILATLVFLVILVFLNFYFDFKERNKKNGAF